MVIQDTSNRILWQSGTGGHTGAYLEITDTAPWLAVRDSQGAVLWTYYGLPSNSMLRAGQARLVGQEIVSPSGTVKVSMESDGSLRLSRDVVGGIWSSGPSSARYAFMQGDGNLVLCDDAGTVVWQTKTAGTAGAHLAVTDLSVTPWLEVRTATATLWTWCVLPVGKKLPSSCRILYGQQIVSQRRTTKLALSEQGLTLWVNTDARGWTKSWEILTNSPSPWVQIWGGRPQICFGCDGLTVKDVVRGTSFTIGGRVLDSTKNFFDPTSVASVDHFVVGDGAVYLIDATHKRVGTLGTVLQAL